MRTRHDQVRLDRGRAATNGSGGDTLEAARARWNEIGDAIAGLQSTDDPDMADEAETMCRAFWKERDGLEKRWGRDALEGRRNGDGR